MPRPDVGRERIMFRDDPTPIDEEALSESLRRGTEITRSEMVRVLVGEALVARRRRARRRTRNTEAELETARRRFARREADLRPDSTGEVAQ